MNVYLGLRDDWFFLENPAVLDAIEALQDMADGTFYPTEYGPESLADIACPNLWGYLVPQAEAEPFEHLFVAREDKQIAKLYEGRFTYAQWSAGVDGEAKVSFLPAPVSEEEPPCGRYRQEDDLGTVLDMGAWPRRHHRHALRFDHGLVRS